MNLKSICQCVNLPDMVHEPALLFVILQSYVTAGIELINDTLSNLNELWTLCVKSIITSNLKFMTLAQPRNKGKLNAQAKSNCVCN